MNHPATMFHPAFDDTFKLCGGHSLCKHEAVGTCVECGDDYCDRHADEFLDYDGSKGSLEQPLLCHGCKKALAEEAAEALAHFPDAA